MHSIDRGQGGARLREKYWRRTPPHADFDILRLMPASLPKGRRFETLLDAQNESIRSERLLAGYRPDSSAAAYLGECRAGYFECEQSFCPICARVFRRFFTGELLRLHAGLSGSKLLLVVLLEAAPVGNLHRLDIDRHRHALRKRLSRAGLDDAIVIGGFEMVYRADMRQWVLHVNLLIAGGGALAISSFKRSARKAAGPELRGAIKAYKINDPAVQLSYLLKFTTYHRPYVQVGSKKSMSVPLNPKQHFELVSWMSQYAFSDYVFLFNVRRAGSSFVRNTDARKA